MFSDVGYSSCRPLSYLSLARSSMARWGSSSFQPAFLIFKRSINTSREDQMLCHWHKCCGEDFVTNRCICIKPAAFWRLTRYLAVDRKMKSLEAYRTLTDADLPWNGAVRNLRACSNMSVQGDQSQGQEQQHASQHEADCRKCKCCLHVPALTVKMRFAQWHTI